MGKGILLWLLFAKQAILKPAGSPDISGNGRGDRIRTCDILLPKQARYQTALLPGARGP